MITITDQKDVCALIVAAGSGARAGGEPKQFRNFMGKPMLHWSVEAFGAHPRIAQIIIVTASDRFESIKPLAHKFPIILTPGGQTRTDSVRAGLAAIKEHCSVVLIHDAARPGLLKNHIDVLLLALEDCDGAAPALALPDAIKRIDAGGVIVGEIDRSGLQRVQTPQAFKRKKIADAYEVFGVDVSASDDLAVAANAGCRVKLVPGDFRLDKVTFAEDFQRMEQMLSAPKSIRVGAGFDVHAFGPGDSVWLCGVHIHYSASLIGHSDADVAWHALTDAILGAIADGDIGDHFPPSDEQWRGMNSERFLRYAAERLAARGGAITHVDLTIICEAPKIKPYREAMRRRTADILEIELDRVSIKATTTEGLGFLGRREGLAAQACATISL